MNIIQNKKGSLNIKNLDKIFYVALFMIGIPIVCIILIMSTQIYNILVDFNDLALKITLIKPLLIVIICLIVVFFIPLIILRKYFNHLKMKNKKE